MKTTERAWAGSDKENERLNKDNSLNMYQTRQSQATFDELFQKQKVNIKVAFKTEEEKRKLFSNLKAVDLKAVEKFDQVTIANDYAERQNIKEQMQTK